MRSARREQSRCTIRSAVTGHDAERRMNASHVLIIEDNKLLATGLQQNLEFEGYSTSVAHTGSDGMRIATECSSALIVLDLMLPDVDGFSILETLRARGVDTPVLVLTALGNETDKVRGFRAGADDYVTKPFGLMELLARVAALLRRSHTTSTRVSQHVHAVGALAINVDTREVTYRGARVALRPKELDLLIALARRSGAIATRDELLAEVWGYSESVFSRTVDTHIAELRRKLEVDAAAPQMVLTVRKAGYRLAV